MFSAIVLAKSCYETINISYFQKFILNIENPGNSKIILIVLYLRISPTRTLLSGVLIRYNVERFYEENDR